MLRGIGFAVILFRTGRDGLRKLDPDIFVIVAATKLENERPVVSVDLFLYIQFVRRFMAALQTRKRENTYQDGVQLRSIPLINLLPGLEI